jgi:hypothetical protein
MKTIRTWEWKHHGVQHEQYFQGAGVSFTDWPECYTGIGSSEKEAANDALEQAAMEWEVPDDLSDEAEGFDDTSIHADVDLGIYGDSEEEQEEGRRLEEELDGDDSCHYYVTIYVSEDGPCGEGCPGVGCDEEHLCPVIGCPNVVEGHKPCKACRGVET